MIRPDLARIADLIAQGSRVLDLGCGDGALLGWLADNKGCTGTGVEIAPEQVTAAVRAGVNVIDLDLDSQLSLFLDKSYDVVVLSRTLQNVSKPRDVLQQMARIGTYLVVSMPNFTHYRNRWQLIRGWMPVSSELPFEWYNTPNIHYTSLKDLEPVFTSLDLRIVKRLALDTHGKPLNSRFANLRASSAVYLLRA